MSKLEEMRFRDEQRRTAVAIDEAIAETCAEIATELREVASRPSTSSQVAEILCLVADAIAKAGIE